MLDGKSATDKDKALLCAIGILSTQHDPASEQRSFSHLTFEEIFSELVKQWEQLERLVVLSEIYPTRRPTS